LAQKRNRKDKERSLHSQKKGEVITVVITSKTQIKEKVLKVKTLGYLPRVLFFNAFELGAESANQVISSESLRSTVGTKK
jgi:hypothetical protein